MRIVANIDQNFFPPGSGSQFTTQTATGGYIVVMNMAENNVIMTFANGAQTYLPANDKRKYDFTSESAIGPGNQIVTWVVDSFLPLNQTVNHLIVESYQPGECSVETYPAIFVRGVSVFT